MTPDLRWFRLRAAWVLVAVFLFFARPTPWSLVAGGAVAFLGAGLRAWAAGTIRKGRELAVRGPYAFTRNPLYLGSLLIGIGVTVAGARPLFFALFLVFFAGVYWKTMRGEAEALEERFGHAYREYRSRVPILLPRLTPYSPPRGGWAEDRVGGGGFSLPRYNRNREWEALLGLAAGFGALVAKMVWF